MAVVITARTTATRTRKVTTAPEVARTTRVVAVILRSRSGAGRGRRAAEPQVGTILHFFDKRAAWLE